MTTRQALARAIVLAAVILILCVATVYEIAGWNYCITSGNPWWYCLRLLGR